MRLTVIVLLLSFSMAAQIKDAKPEKHKATVFFDFNESILTADAAEILDAIATQGNIEVSSIYGFCDDKGSNGYNDTLSLKRVASVYDHLKNKGFKINRNYESKGYGEDFEQSEIQSENRKVVVIYEVKMAETIKPQISEPKEATFTEKVRASTAGDKIRLKNINFHNNSAAILPKSRSILTELLAVLVENPKLKIEIQGHICCQPKKDVNDVSTSRAKAIYNFLIENKIDRKRLSFKGFGISKPIYPIPEKSPDQEEENRRVEILIVAN